MTMPRFWRLFVPVPVVLLALLALLCATPARAAGFSTDPVEVAPSGTAQTVVSAVRTGHHAGFDRLVFTFAGPVPGYSVAYVPQVIQDGSGAPLTLQGSSFAAITLRPTSTSTRAPQDRTSPHFPMLRQVAGAGDVEAVTTYGVGLAGRSGLRVLTLTAPNRLVVDFAIPAGAGTPAATDGTSEPITVESSGATTSPRAVADGTGSDSDGTTALPDSGPPTGTLVAGGIGLAVLGTACYLLLRRRAAGTLDR